MLLSASFHQNYQAAVSTNGLTYITAYRCHVFFTISNVYIQAVLNVILTFVLPQHVLKLNKQSNVNKSPLINIYFVIAGLENKWVFLKIGMSVSS